jgi:hypothetical protein
VPSRLAVAVESDVKCPPAGGGGRVEAADEEGTDANDDESIINAFDPAEGDEMSSVSIRFLFTFPFNPISSPLSSPSSFSFALLASVLSLSYLSKRFLFLLSSIISLVIPLSSFFLLLNTETT